MATWWEWWHHCLSLAKTEPLHMQTTLLPSRTCRCSGPSAGTGSWSPFKCGEIFRSNWSHSRLLALILDKQDKQSWLKWKLVINTLFSCFFFFFNSSKSNAPSLKVSWGMSGGFLELIFTWLIMKILYIIQTFHIVWCSQNSWEESRTGDLTFILDSWKLRPCECRWFVLRLMAISDE